MSFIEKIWDTDNSYFLNNPVIHLPGYLQDHKVNEVQKVLSSIEYEPLRHNGIIARYEKHLSVDELPLNIKIEETLKIMQSKFGYPKSCKTEYYAFKYTAGQFVPEHRDKPRHKVIFMLHVGSFVGGEYIYTLNDLDNSISLSCGDAVISVNECGPGHWQNPLHRVNKIQDGIRYTVAGSLISD